MFAGKAVSS